MSTSPEAQRVRPRLVRRPKAKAAPADQQVQPAAAEEAMPPAAAPPAPRSQQSATPAPRKQITPAPRYDTQVIPFWFVGRVVQLAVWFGCFLSFLATTVGNIGLFGGDLAQAALGWRYFTSPAFLVPFVPSIPYQFVVQMFQFYAARKYGQSSWQYRTTLGFSVVPSGWTYGRVVVPWVWSIAAVSWGDVWLIRLPMVAALLVAGVVVIVLNDMIQEWILVKREA
jgi:hypothetical protein